MSSFTCNAAEEDESYGEIVAAVVQAVGLLVTVIAGGIAYLLNEMNARRQSQAELDRESAARHERDIRQDEHRRHQNERDVATHHRDANAKRLEKQMHSLITPLVNQTHSLLRSVHGFVHEMCEDFRDELLAVQSPVAPPELPSVVTSLHTEASTTVVTGGERNRKGDVDHSNPLVMAASTFASDRSYGWTDRFERTPLRASSDRHTWEAPLEASALTIIPPGEGNNVMFLIHLPSFFADWIRACFRADDAFVRREFPAVVYEAIRLSGFDSELAAAYRSWARDMFVPIARAARAILTEFGSFVQPLPWASVDACLERFNAKCKRETMKGKPRCFAYVNFDVYVAAWERLLLRWEAGDHRRLYPVEMFPVGMMFYTFRMQNMVATRQEAVCGHSYLTETNVEEALADAAKITDQDAFDKFLEKQSATVLRAIGRSSMVTGDNQFFSDKGADAIRQAAGQELIKRSATKVFLDMVPADCAPRRNAAL